MMIPVMNMINEMHALDTSRKIRLANRQMMEEGKFVGARAPYGYQKDPNDCHKLIIDPETAPVVKQIFEWAYEKAALTEIIKRLNQRGILTPSLYFAKKHPNAGNYRIGNGIWHTWSISKILANEVYAGNMVQGKNVGFKRKQTKVEDKSKWIVVENTHEAIVSKELFDAVQEYRSAVAKNDKQKICNPFTENIFVGKIFCGICGRNLHRDRRVYVHSTVYSYQCLSRYEGKEKHRVYIREEVLIKVIMDILTEYSKIMSDISVAGDNSRSRLAAQCKNNSDKISANSVRLKALDKITKSLYENLANGIISKDEYKEFGDKYAEEANELKAENAALQEQIHELETEYNKCIATSDTLFEAVSKGALTRKIVDALIERIEVIDQDHVNIVFTFKDEFKKLKECGVFTNA